MINTSVMDVVAVANNQNAVPVNQKVNAVNSVKKSQVNAKSAPVSNSFRQVFDKQLGQTNQTDSSKQKDVSAKESDGNEFSRYTNREDMNKTDESVDISKKPETQTEEPEDLDEQTMETLQSSAMELVTEVAKVLNVDEQDILEKMEEIGISPLMLLNQETLGQLVTELQGVEDSLNLVVNEELYTEFKDVLNTGKELVEQLKNEFGISDADLEKAISLQDNAEPEEAQLISEDKNSEVIINVSDKKEVKEEAKPSDSEQSESKNEDLTQNNQPEYVVTYTNSDNSVQQVVTQTVQQNSFANDVDTQNIMRQIMDYMKVNVEPDLSSVEMQLHPASLGSLHIHVVNNGGVMTANFVTQNEAVKAALESQMIQLQESFLEQGIKVESIEVTVATQQFQSELDQRNEETNQGSGRRNRNRRFHAEGIQMDSLNDMKPQEQLAAKIMAANGSV